MRSRTVVALAALALVPLATACSSPGGTAANTQEQSYEVTEPITALVIDAQAARVIVEAGAGPVTVTEIHRYDDARPTTTEQLVGVVRWEPVGLLAVRPSADPICRRCAPPWPVRRARWIA